MSVSAGGLLPFGGVRQLNAMRPNTFRLEPAQATVGEFHGPLEQRRPKRQRRRALARQS